MKFNIFVKEEEKPSLWEAAKNIPSSSGPGSLGNNRQRERDSPGTGSLRGQGRPLPPFPSALRPSSLRVPDSSGPEVVGRPEAPGTRCSLL